MDKLEINTFNNEIKRKIIDKIKRRVNKLHELGISHGDLKEKNIMIKKTKKGNIGVRVIDFGLSDIGNKEKIAKDRKDLEKIIKKLKSY